MPRFQYFLPGVHQPVSADMDAWHTALPLDRHAARQPASVRPDAGWTHGDYFTAARTFLERDGYGVVLRAVSHRLGRPAAADDISDIRITIIKHGAFYHPAHILVCGLETPVELVLNTAVSPRGRETIAREYAALDRLSQTRGHGLLPVVYGQGAMPAGSGVPFEMFLGDWFAGFHEFHLSRDAADSPVGIRVWDAENGFFYLTPAQTRTLYRQAAFILSAYYNPRTCEQIFPWHHAAGDFVVGVDTAGLHVRLITVRAYAPLFEDMETPGDSNAQRERMMLGLLVLLLNLSIRMRIDRIDGTGALAWAGEEAVMPVWEGFMAGLTHSFYPAGFPDDLPGAFQSYLSDIPLSHVFDLAGAAAGGFHPQAPERELIEGHLVDHVAGLWASMEQPGEWTRDFP